MALYSSGTPYRFHLFFLFFWILSGKFANAQPPQYKMQVYIAKYADLAIAQMVEYKIPASITLAQAIFESRSGASELAKRSNNHFGIKCHVEWQGDTIVKHDDTLNECFRKYREVKESYQDHSQFLSSRARYACLFQFAVNDYKSWCTGLKEAGYATYESYAEELIRLIEQTELYRFDGVQSLALIKPYDNNHAELKKSAFNPRNFSLARYAEHGLLWTDEKEAHIRSLDLILKQKIGSGSASKRD